MAGQICCSYLTSGHRILIGGQKQKIIPVQKFRFLLKVEACRNIIYRCDMTMIKLSCVHCNQQGVNAVHGQYVVSAP